MKKADIKIGGHYLMKVSGSVVPVRVDTVREISSFQGRVQTVYDCTNLKTGRSCKAHSAAKFRGPFATDTWKRPNPTTAVGAAPEPIEPIADSLHPNGF